MIKGHDHEHEVKGQSGGITEERSRGINPGVLGKIKGFQPKGDQEESSRPKDQLVSIGGVMI